jgi:putative tryptophan/tyrosine transport system substrate-binding protein
MALCIGRRQFIGALGGAAVAWPLTARAQQPERMRRIGVLVPSTKTDAQALDHINAFEQGLQKLGWTDGRNLRIEYRWAGSDQQQLRSSAAELVGLNPEVILAPTALTLLPLQQTTANIPIVFLAIYDPVGSGFVSNLARPEGNITGRTLGEFTLGGKMLERLKEIAPKIDHSTIVLKPDQAPQVALLHAIEAVAPALGVRLTAAPVLEAGEIDAAIKTAVREPNGGIVVLSNPLTLRHREQVTAFAARYGLPAVYGSREFVEVGGLVSYGANLADEYRRAAEYIDRILKGAMPAELPVQQPTHFELVINLKTAKSLGLAIPQSLLATADEVIE